MTKQMIRGVVSHLVRNIRNAKNKAEVVESISRQFTVEVAMDFMKLSIMEVIAVINVEDVFDLTKVADH